MSTGTNVDERRWRLFRGHRLRTRCWDADEIVVYHPGSGETHLLNDSAAAILDLLREAGPLDAASVLIAFGRRFEVDPDDDLRRGVENMLLHLDGLGLVERCP